MFDKEHSFLQKFYQLKKAGLSAHLDLDTHAGEAWVGLRVRLGHEGGPLHQPHIPTKRDSPSRQRRRARRAASRHAEEALEEIEKESKTIKAVEADEIVLAGEAASNGADEAVKDDLVTSVVKHEYRHFYKS